VYGSAPFVNQVDPNLQAAADPAVANPKQNQSLSPGVQGRAYTNETVNNAAKAYSNYIGDTFKTPTPAYTNETVNNAANAYSAWEEAKKQVDAGLSGDDKTFQSYQSNPDYKTTYVDANGNERDAIIRNGKTLNADGSEISGAFTVKAANGKYYQKDANGNSYQVDEAAYNNGKKPSGVANNAAQNVADQWTGSNNAAANQIAAQAAASGSAPYKTVYRTPDGDYKPAYIINGATYTDPSGTTPIPTGSIVRDEKGRAWSKGENGSQMIYSPDMNDYWFHDDIPGTGKGTNIPWQEIRSIPVSNADYSPEGYDYTDWRNGNIGMRAEGGYNVYDGKQNTVGYFDSAGNWHGTGGKSDRSDTWEKAARAALEAQGITADSFKGNGLDYEGKMPGGWRDDVGSKNTLKWHYNDALGKNTPYVYDPFANVDMDYVYGNQTPETGGEPITPRHTPKSGNGGQNGRYPTGGDLDYDYTGNGNGTSGAPSMADILALLGGGNGGFGVSDSGGGTELNPELVQAPEAPDLKPMLDEWRANEEARQQQAIDYTTEQGVKNLQRTEEDAQQGFRTAQEQIAADEMASRDNQALYAEARGDKGGIGAAQYDAIANTAAKNRQSVRDAQTKLATDTARQIEDLRNQGEFKKADALLQVSQEYLQNLMSLEQWAANYGLSAAQFNESVREWAENFKLNVAQITGELNGKKTLAARNADRDFALNLANYELNRTNADRNFGLSEANVTGYYKGLPTMSKTNSDRDFALNEASVTGMYNGRPTAAQANADRNFRISEAGVTGEYNGQPTYSARNSSNSNLSTIGMSMLKSGIMPSSEMLRAMGISDADAQAYIMGMQAKSSSKGGTGGYQYGNPTSYDNLSNAVSALFADAQSSGLGAAYINKTNLAKYGLTGYTASDIQKQFDNWTKNNADSTYVDPTKPISQNAKDILRWLQSSNGGAKLTNEQKIHSIFGFATSDDGKGGDYSYSDGKKYHAEIDLNDRNWLLRELGLI
jgi:hypothetical protein